MSKTFILRVQSPCHGTKRITTSLSESIAGFMDKVQTEFGLKDSGWSLWKNQKRTERITYSRAKKLSSLHLQHGEMLYLSEEDKVDAAADPEPMEMGNSAGNSAGPRLITKGVLTATSSSSSLASPPPPPLDEIDVILEKEDGKIYRKRNEQLCRHGPQGKCLHCVPLEPYDEEFLKTCQPPIKFLSFHSYLRKLTGGVDKGKFVNLENLSCQIKPGCKEHLPWPHGICTKCQPTAITLNRQPYRHVDYISFENSTIPNKFLDYWRQTGCQRLGIMFGRYEQHKEIPLGIRATVCAIYEPPQENSKNKIRLLENPNMTKVEKMAEKLGLQPVGWIFTDLIPEDMTAGTVKNIRGSADSHFLSAEECIMAADFQNKYPNPCRMSPNGYFGSKFVTVIVTGDNNNMIHFEGYQVSNQCMALVRDKCLIPTIDVPELGYVKESTNEQYVPDVFYKEKDSYGNEVTQLARPLPVEYLLVDLSAAFPVEQTYTFNAMGSSNVRNYNIENRADTGEGQTFADFQAYMAQFSGDKFLEAMSDFHLLAHMCTWEMITLQHVDLLLEAVKTKDEAKALQYKLQEEWANVEQFMVAQGATNSSRGSFVGPGASPLPPIGSSTGFWTCVHCTFDNQLGHQNCEMCSLPRQ